MKNYQVTEFCHLFIKEHVKEGGFCIDATAGRGYDTLLLCELVGKRGKVLAFDIQEQALESTRSLVEEHQVCEPLETILAGHETMDQYATESTIDCIVFNFGYLPGGDHHIATKVNTSIEAIEKGLKLLKKKGLMSLCIYSGGHSGFTEKEAILAFLSKLDPKKYLVITSQYYNRENNPPMPVSIYKL